MIVLDEQLLSYGIQESIARWYRGAVTDITQLRPHTVILDEAIPCCSGQSLTNLRHDQRRHFWGRLTPDPRFCIVCCAVPHTRAQAVPDLLRRVLTLEPFRTRSRRLGKIVHVSPNTFNTTQRTANHTPRCLAQGPAPGAKRLSGNALLACYASSSNNALASCKSAVSNPSVNQP